MANKRIPPVPAVNITPLVDVLLILLVVLLLAMPLYVKRLPVDLPQTSLAGAPTPVNALPVAIQKDLTVSVRGVPVDAEWSAVTLDSSTTVELSVDKEVTYDVIAKTLARLQEKHPKEIILITR